MISYIDIQRKPIRDYYSIEERLINSQPVRARVFRLDTSAVRINSGLNLRFLISGP